LAASSRMTVGGPPGERYSGRFEYSPSGSTGGAGLGVAWFGGVKTDIFCALPFSVTVKSAGCSPSTGWPCLSVTTTSTSTRRVATRMVRVGTGSGSWGDCAGSGEETATSERQRTPHRKRGLTWHLNMVFLGSSLWMRPLSIHRGAIVPQAVSLGWTGRGRPFPRGLLTALLTAASHRRSFTCEFEGGCAWFLLLLCGCPSCCRR